GVGKHHEHQTPPQLLSQYPMPHVHLRFGGSCILPGPHRHNWLNADGQGVDARRHVVFRSGSPKSLRAPTSCGHTVFGARPVSDGPYQPVDAADVQRRVAFGARQDDEFANRHCCVHRSRWSVPEQMEGAPALRLGAQLDLAKPAQLATCAGPAGSPSSPSVPPKGFRSGPGRVHRSSFISILIRDTRRCQKVPNIKSQINPRVGGWETENLVSLRHDFSLYLTQRQGCNLSSIVA
ncbi:hypothetical protein THAOC_08708, partial [Thalassiosira oceanica]